MFGLFGRKKETIDLSDLIDKPKERRASERRDTYADAVATSEKGRFLKKGIALDLSANGTFAELLKAARQTTLEGHAHQDVTVL